MESDYIKEFNDTYTTKSIAKLKVLQHFTSGMLNPYLAFYIKYMELERTYLALHDTSNSCSPTEFSIDQIADFLRAIRPCSSQTECEMYDQILSALDAFETYKTMSETMGPEFFSEMFNPS